MCIGKMQRVCVVGIVELISVCDWCDSGADDQSAITSANSISKGLGHPCGYRVMIGDGITRSTCILARWHLPSHTFFSTEVTSSSKKQGQNDASFWHDWPYLSKMKGREKSSLSQLQRCNHPSSHDFRKIVDTKNHNCAPHVMCGESRPAFETATIDTDNPIFVLCTVTAQHVNPLWRWRTPRLSPPTKFKTYPAEPSNTSTPKEELQKTWSTSILFFQQKPLAFRTGNTYLCTYVNIYTYIHMYIHIYVCTYTCIHIYKYNVWGKFSTILSPNQRMRQVQNMNDKLSLFW